MQSIVLIEARGFAKDQQINPLQSISLHPPVWAHPHDPSSYDRLWSNGCVHRYHDA